MASPISDPDTDDRAGLIINDSLDSSGDAGAVTGGSSSDPEVLMNPPMNHDGEAAQNIGNLDEMTTRVAMDNSDIFRCVYVILQELCLILPYVGIVY